MSEDNMQQRLKEYRPRGSGKEVIRKILVVSLTLLALVLAADEARSQAKVGTTGVNFLEIGVSARAMGMAEAFVAVVDDISAVYYNPAGLTSLYSREVGFTYIDHVVGVQYAFGAIGLPLESIGGVLGIGVYALTSGSMDETTYSYPRGTGRTFAHNDLAVSIGYGRYLTDRFSIGFTVRYIREEIQNYAASGWSADVGTLYDTGFRGFRIGMAITNFGPDMTLISNPFPLPINFRFGGAINLVESVDHLVTFSAEGSHPSDNLEKYNSGVEYVFKDRFSLRGGGRFNYDVDGFTAGGGIRQPLPGDREIRFDYAFQDFGILTELHRITMVIAF